MKKIFKWACGILAAGILLLLLVYVLRGPLISPYLSRWIIDTAAAELEVQLEIGDISGTYFSSLDVSDLTTVQPNPAGPLVSLNLSRLKIRYSLLRLLAGWDGFLEDLRIDIDGARIALRIEEDQKDSEDESQIYIPGLPPGLPTIRIGNSTVTIEAGEARTRLENISLATQPRRPDGTQLTLAVSEWSWNHPALHDQTVALSASASLTGEKITLEQLNLGEGRVIASASADLRQAPAAIPFQAQIQVSEGLIALSGRWTDSRIELQTTARHLDLAPLPIVVKLPHAELGGIMDWEADASLDTGSPPASKAQLAVTISNGRIADTAIDLIDLKTTLADEQITVAHLAARTAGNDIRFEDIHAPAPLVFAGDLEELAGRINGKFSIQAENLPAIFKTFGAPSEADQPSPAHVLTLRGQFDQGNLQITAGSLTSSAGSVLLRPLQVQIPTPARPWSQSTIQGGCDVTIGALRPIAALFALPAVDGSLKADIAISGTLGAPEGRAAIGAKNLAWQHVDVDTVVVSASADAERIVVDTLEINRGQDRITGNGAYHLPSGNLEKTQVDLNFSDLHPYLVMLAPAIDGFDPQKARIDGGLRGSVLLSGPISRPDGSADLKIRALKFRDRQFGDAVIDVRKQGERISIKGLRLERGEDNVSLRGGIDLAAKSATALSLSARIADIGWYTQHLLPPAWAAAGAVRLDVEASGPLEQPDAIVRADFKQLELGEIRVETAALRASSKGRLIQVDLAEAESPDAGLKLSGAVLNNWADGGLSAQVDACDIRLHDLALSLAQRARVDYSRSGSVSFDRLTLQGKSGQVSLSGTLTPKGASDLRLEVADLIGAEWFKALTGGQVRFAGLNGNIHLSGELEQPMISGAGNAAGIVIGDYPDALSGEFDLGYTRRGLAVRRLDLRAPTGPDLSLSGNFPVQVLPELALLPGPLEATGNFSIPDIKIVNAFVSQLQVSSGDMRAEFQLGGSWQHPSGRVLVRGDGVDFDADWQPLPPGPYTFKGDLNIEDTRLTIQSLQLESPSLSAGGRGEWNNIPSPAAFIQGTAGEPYGELAVEGKVVIPDLGWLARGVDALRRTSGRLEADLRLTGPAVKPDFQSVLRMSDGEVLSNSDIPSLRAIDLIARLSSKGLQLERLEAQLGGAPVQASGILQWGGDGNKNVDLSLQGTNVLLYRDESIMLRADTDLKFQGPFERMAVSGDLAVTKGLVKRNLNIFGALREPGGPKSGPGLQLFSLPEPPLRDMRFDVRLTAKSPIDIRGNLAHGSVRPDLHLGGTGLLPVLTGKVYVDPTRVSLPSGRLTVESGVVQFLETDPELPVLELRGSSRMLGYDITVLVEGPYNEPEITLSSIPPLPGDDLMLLLLTGQPPKGTLGRSGQQRQNIQVALYVGRDLLTGWFSGDSPEEIEDVMDRFDFQLGRDVTRSGDETIEVQFRLADGLILDRDRLYITGEKDSYDYINTGVKLVFRFK